MSDTVNKELLRHIVKLEPTKQEQVLKYVKHLLEEDFADNLSPEQIASIERGLSDIKEGNTQSHEDVKKRYKKWL